MKKELYGLFAGDMPRVNWLLGLNTLIRGLKDYQGEIASERDSLVTEMAKRKLRDSAKGSVNASQPRKDKVHVTPEAIEAMRVEFMFNKARDGGPEGCDHGWIAYAAKELKVDRNTIKARMKRK